MKSLDDILRRQEYLQQNMKKVDPFDKGISKAIQSAKMSLGMDRDQSHAAIRSALGNFTNNLNNDNAPPAKNGFGRIAQMGNALTQAVGQYDNYENAAVNHNRNLAKDEMARREQEYAKAVALEKMAADRDFAEKELGIRQKANELKAEANLLKKQGKGGKETAPEYTKELVKHNFKKLEKLEEKAERAKLNTIVLKEFRDFLASANEQGLAGTSLKHELNRKYARYFGNSPELSYEDMMKMAYIARTKELGGSNPSTKEVEIAFKTIPTTSQEFNTALNILTKDIDNAEHDIKTYDKFNEDMLESNFLGRKTYERTQGSVVENKPERMVSIKNGNEVVNVPVSELANENMYGNTIIDPNQQDQQNQQGQIESGDGLVEGGVKKQYEKLIKFKQFHERHPILDKILRFDPFGTTKDQRKSKRNGNGESDFFYPQYTPENVEQKLQELKERANSFKK